jgi:LPS-assembly lipoprotein
LFYKILFKIKYLYDIGFHVTRHLAVIVAVAGLLSACGFHLRGAAQLPYDTLHVAAPRTSAFAVEFRRAVATGSKTRVVDNPKEAQASLQLINETREKVILSLSGGGRVREFQLRYRMSYRLIDKDSHELRPATQITLQRDISYNDTDTLAKESEEALLYRDMQTDAVSQLLRQLQTPRAGG